MTPLVSTPSKKGHSCPSFKGFSWFIGLKDQVSQPTSTPYFSVPSSTFAFLSFFCC